MHHEYLWGRQCAFVFPIYVRKYRKYTIDRWIVVYTVCASVVISPLKQWLDSCAKLVWKCVTRSSICIHMHYFLLLSSLVIVFVYWVSTGVLYEPRQCSLFWDYILESKLCCCLNRCESVPPVRSIFNPANTEIAQLSNQRRVVRGAAPFWWPGSNQKQRCGSDFAKWHIFTPEECADGWRQNNADLKLLENCVMNGFFMFSIKFMTATRLDNSPQSFDVYTVP